jgi:hypothetical protein
VSRELAGGLPVVALRQRPKSLTSTLEPVLGCRTRKLFDIGLELGVEPAAERSFEHETHSVKIGALIDPFPCFVLGRHPVRRALSYIGANEGQVGGHSGLGNPEV